MRMIARVVSFMILRVFKIFFSFQVLLSISVLKKISSSDCPARGASPRTFKCAERTNLT